MGKIKNFFSTNEAKIKNLFSTNGTFDWKQFYYGLYIVLFVIGLTYFLWLVYFEDNPPAEVFDARASPAIVETSGEIYYTLDWCKYTDSYAQVRMVWKNDFVHIVPAPDPFYIPPGCHETILHGTVPDALASGEYTIEVEVVYQVNHFAERTTGFEMGPVVVIDKDS